MKNKDKTIKVVVAGSASLQPQIEKWREYWNNQPKHYVIDCTKPIDGKDYLKKYSRIHKKFFRNILKADIIFIANEDKRGIPGYIGAEVFAELVYAMMQNLIAGQKIKIILAKMPSSKVQSYVEIQLWLKLGWIEIFKR